MKPLIFVPSPRNIEDVEDCIDLLPYDKLWVKYYPEAEAYETARNWFRQHKEYTHLVIHPDDLLVKTSDMETLIQDIEEFNFGVINGWCRNTIRLTPYWQGEQETEDQAESNISFNLPPNPPISGTYSQYQFITIPFIDVLKQAGENIIEIKYAGFPLTFISRKLVEQIPFRWEGCCVDSCFSLDLAKNKINQHCDLRVRTVHMNIDPSELQVGKKDKELIFESCA